MKILTILILPVCKYELAFHVRVSISIAFISDSKFQLFRSSMSSSIYYSFLIFAETIDRIVPLKLLQIIIHQLVITLLSVLWWILVLWFSKIPFLVLLPFECGSSYNIHIISWHRQLMTIWLMLLKFWCPSFFLFPDWSV